jgi:hypothetical protein
MCIFLFQDIYLEMLTTIDTALLQANCPWRLETESISNVLGLE